MYRAVDVAECIGQIAGASVRDSTRQPTYNGVAGIAVPKRRRRRRAHGPAEVIVLRLGSKPMSAFKLQKLVYYSEAWHLVHLHGPLIREDFEAWVNGPVVRELYRHHRGLFELQSVQGDARRIGQPSRGLVEEVMAAYGKLPAGRLIEMTHSDAPWREAREGLAPMESSNRRISKDRMRSFYQSLLTDPTSVAL